MRELEQLLQSLEVQKSIRNNRRGGSTDAAGSSSSPFAAFFSFPQYSTSPAHGSSSSTSLGGSSNTSNNAASSDVSSGGSAESGRPAAVADIEVTMVEGHASLKVLARRRPKQLLKLVAGLHQLRIPPLHLNMTTVDAMVLYTFSLKVIISTARTARGCFIKPVETNRAFREVERGVARGHCSLARSISIKLTDEAGDGIAFPVWMAGGG